MIFRTDWIKKWKPTIWQRIKLRLFGRTVIGVDVAKDGSDTTVKARYYKGKYYIREVIKND